jgi:hypothetical protein
MISPAHSPSMVSVEVLNKFLKDQVTEQIEDHTDDW